MLLGLTVDQFMDMTPRLFNAVWKQYCAAEERANQRFALLGFRFFQAMGVKKEGGKAFTPEEMGVTTPKGEKPKKRMSSAQRMYAEAQAITLRGEAEKRKAGTVVQGDKL